MIERREAPRLTPLPRPGCRVGPTGDPSSFQPAELADLSPVGVGLITRSPAVPMDCLVVELTNPATGISHCFEVEVRNVQPGEGATFRVGGEFRERLTARDFAALLP